MKNIVLVIAIVLCASMINVQSAFSQTGPKSKNKKAWHKPTKQSAVSADELIVIRGPEAKNVQKYEIVSLAPIKVSEPDGLKGPKYKNKKHPNTSNSGSELPNETIDQIASNEEQ